MIEIHHIAFVLYILGAFVVGFALGFVMVCCFAVSGQISGREEAKTMTVPLRNPAVLPDNWGPTMDLDGVLDTHASQEERGGRVP